MRLPTCIASVATVATTSPVASRRVTWSPVRVTCLPSMSETVNAALIQLATSAMWRRAAAPAVIAPSARRRPA